MLLGGISLSNMPSPFITPPVSHIPSERESALLAQIYELKICASLKKGPPSETRSHSGNFEDDQDDTPRGQPLTHADIHNLL